MKLWRTLLKTASAGILAAAVFAGAGALNPASVSFAAPPAYQGYVMTEDAFLGQAEDISSISAFEDAVQRTGFRKIRLTKDLKREWSGQHGTIYEVGEGTLYLDLHGHTIEFLLKDEEYSRGSGHEATLFSVASGANVIIADSTEKLNGELYFNAYIHDTKDFNEGFYGFAVRNVFKIYPGGSVMVNSGNVKLRGKFPRALRLRPEVRQRLGLHAARRHAHSERRQRNRIRVQLLQGGRRADACRGNLFL